MSSLQLTMPPTTPYAGKFNSCSLYGNNNNHPQPHSPYRNGTASKPAKENIYNNSSYPGSENPYDIPQPHGCYRSSSVSSVTAKEHHYGSNYAVSENPYSPPQPRSPRQHSSSCPGRAYRHTTTTTSTSSGSGGSGGSSSEQSCRNNNNVAAGKARLYGHGITASYGEMCYHDNSLVSASLEALIQHLVPTVDYYPDVSTRKYTCVTFFPVFVNWLNPSELKMSSVLTALTFVALCCVVSSSLEIICVHLPAEFTPLPASVRAHDAGVSPVCGAAAVRRRPAGQGGRITHSHKHTNTQTHTHGYNYFSTFHCVSPT